MKLSMSPRAITERLQAAAGSADLRTHRRLYAKIDMSPKGITARLREVETLRRACLKLGALRRCDAAT